MNYKLAQDWCDFFLRHNKVYKMAEAVAERHPPADVANLSKDNEVEITMEQMVETFGTKNGYTNVSNSLDHDIPNLKSTPDEGPLVGTSTCPVFDWSASEDSDTEATAQGDSIFHWSAEEEEEEALIADNLVFQTLKDRIDEFLLMSNTRRSESLESSERIKLAWKCIGVIATFLDNIDGLPLLNASQQKQKRHAIVQLTSLGEACDVDISQQGACKDSEPATVDCSTDEGLLYWPDKVDVVSVTDNEVFTALQGRINDFLANETVTSASLEVSARIKVAWLCVGDIAKFLEMIDDLPLLNPSQRQQKKQSIVQLTTFGAVCDAYIIEHTVTDKVQQQHTHQVGGCRKLCLSPFLLVQSTNPL
jgi:hypothetical protein